MLLIITADAAETTKERSSSSSSPYVLIIDGGSTGSRLHAFHYVSNNNNYNNHTSLERLTSTRVFQPLTHFVNASTAEVTEHVLPLFTPELAQLIPTMYHATTPVYYAATAGMRLVPLHLQTQVYQRMEQGLQQHPDFPYQIGQLFTLSGDMEALYGVVACNYLQKQQQQRRQGSATHHHHDKPVTVAALDLGGASTQVALPRPNHNATSTTTSTTDSVYAVSHLAFGVDQFQQRLPDGDAFDRLCRNSPTTHAAACADLLRPHLLAARDTLAIPHHHHAFDSTSTTSTDDDDDVEFWAMSLYFYTMDTIRQYTAPLLDDVWPTPTIDELRAATHAFCRIPLPTLFVQQPPHPYTNAQSMADRCYQAVYIIELLKVMGFPDDGDDDVYDANQRQQNYRKIRFLLDVDGSEVEWTLGMALAVQNEPLQQQQSRTEDDEAVSEYVSPVDDISKVDPRQEEEGSCGAEQKTGNKENLTCASSTTTPPHDATVLGAEDLVAAAS